MLLDPSLYGLFVFKAEAISIFPYPFKGAAREVAGRYNNALRHIWSCDEARQFAHLRETDFVRVGILFCLPDRPYQSEVRVIHARYEINPSIS
jgi:hypothetical protein